MAKRLTGQFYDLNGRQHRVDIFDNDYSGSASDIDVKYCQLNYDSSNNDDPTSAIIGSRADIGLKVDFEDTVLPTFIDDYSNGQEDRFFVEIYNMASSRVIWRGIMTPDFAGETDTAPLYEFKVSAVCGLATLKKIPYHDGTAIYEGIERLLKHITTALGKIAHTDVFWDSSAVFIKTAVDKWEATMSSGAADDSLYQAAVDHSAFYDFKTSGNVDKDVLSCYDVIEATLIAMKCRIMMNEGAWWIEDIPYRTASPYTTRHYTKTGTYITNATETGAIVLNQSRSGAKLATMSCDFLPPLKRADITYKVKMRRNLIAGVTDNQPNFNQEISTNGGTAIMRLKFTLNYHITDNGLGAPVGAVYFAIPKVVLKIGSYYLDRPYTIQNYTAIVDAPEWTTSVGGAIYVPIQVGQIVAGTDGVKGSIQVELLTPALPANGSANLFDMENDECEIRKFNNTLMADNLFLKDLHIVDQYLEVFDQGTPFVTEDQTLYTATNDNGASERYEKDVIIGTAGFANSVGRLKVWNGTEWVNAGAWGQGTNPRSHALGSLLSLQIVNQRGKPLRRLNGSVLGNFRIHHLLQDPQDRIWMMSSCTWDIGRNTMQGSWFQLYYGEDGVSSTPVKIKIYPPDSPPIIDPTGPSLGISNQQPGFYSNPPPTVLKPVSYNAIDAKIDKGATVTSIPLDVASFGNEFAANDAVRIVHPITGVYQEFEIDVPPVLGDTALSVVSEVADYDFPEGSYLVVQQRPYAFSLPEANQGEILRFNSVSEQWEAYAGTTDGHVLTWDATNGWQSEAPGGGGGGLSDGDYGDITVSGGGTVMQIDAGAVGTTELAANSVTDSKIRAGAASSVIGRSALTGGDVADIVAVTSGHVLVMTDTGLEFNVIGASSLSDNSVTDAKLRDSAALSVIGRSANTGGDPADIVATNDFEVLRRSGATIGFGQVATGGIADNAVTTAKIAANNVTYAKIQQVAANNVLLGNRLGINNNPQEITMAQLATMAGYIDSAADLTAPRIPYVSAARRITDSANMRWLNATQEILIGDGTSRDARFAHNFTGALAFAELFHGEGQVNGDYQAIIKNTRNLSNTGRAIMILEVGGTNAGDAFYVVRTTGGDQWSLGLDKSDANKFKITPKSTAPGSVANSGIIVTNAAKALVGINKDAPVHPMDIGGTERSEQFHGINVAWAAADLSFGLGAGTAPTFTAMSGTHNFVKVEFSTGTAPTANNAIFTITRKAGYEFSTKGFPVFCAANNNAAGEITKFYMNADNGVQYTMVANGTLTANTPYKLYIAFSGY